MNFDDHYTRENYLAYLEAMIKALRDLPGCGGIRCDDCPLKIEYPAPEGEPPIIDCLDGKIIEEAKLFLKRASRGTSE